MTKKELRQYSDAVATIKSITRVYEQAAARKMRTIKIEIEKINKYIGEADESYTSAKLGLANAHDENMRQLIMRGAFRRPTKSSAVVLLSSQYHHYGSLMTDMAKLFVAEFNKGTSEGIVLGKVGLELIKKYGINTQNISYYDFDEANLDWTTVHAVSQKLADYAKVIVFYGEYKSVLTQLAKQDDISQVVVISPQGEEKKYLFYPKPEKSLSFLENQLISGKFVQKVYESEIAKYAARIKILEIGQVAEKISEAVSDLNRGRRNFRKSQNNKKQQQLFTGSELWKNEGLVTLE